MISNEDEDQFPYAADIGRPTILYDIQRNCWITIHSFIKETHINICVDPNFWYIEDILNNPGRKYTADRQPYCFSFINNEDKKNFIAKINEISVEYNT